jgi:hypothetical protein
MGGIAGDAEHVPAAFRLCDQQRDKVRDFGADAAREPGPADIYLD